MGGAAVKPQLARAELLVSELGGVPGCKAYHSSVLVNETELFFADTGLCTGLGIASHGARSVKRFDMGTTSISTETLREQLATHFLPGTYDLLRKNCNSFSDAALVILVGKRLDKKYRQLEQLGARFPQLVTSLSGGEYSLNSLADSFDLERLCSDLRFGPSWANQGQTLDGEKAGRGGAQHLPAKSAVGSAGSKQPLTRVHILPFQDTFELNFDHMCQKYVLPHIRSHHVADPKTGCGLYVGNEFSARCGQVRFRVVACEPAQGGLPTASTVVLCEGDPINRELLVSATILPLESSMPQLAGKTPEDLARNFVYPFLEQQSSDLRPGQILTIQGLRFKVIKTEPAHGGGPCVATKLTTTGPPVKLCSIPNCESAIAKQCRNKDCKRWVCLVHSADVKETSCLCPAHAPAARKGFLSLMKLTS
ncbi:unnamed protein product [Polarella glacialis]|uniref:PPPDE domain-containing protein n=1 Tax=Polarella glacialis TaxID=89957 RepID=A0A813GL97_POLGL|nr:unnamed protein product [Polarella glacialis]CAE8626056.1 unnamed protein product [Polarella glacialis]CAE8657252.1 unnamed protein product [Polarella glacialis]CAE8718792.1 unnamed protein product [Polarella glacialis]